MKNQYPTNTPSPANRGFTLIELLTAISIISVLGAVAMPAINSALETARMNAAMQGARQIGLGLRGYADDSGGLYPGGENDEGESISTANAAFRDLAEYLDDERVFAVSGSAWGSEAKNGGTYCGSGECHFAYITGQTNTSTSWFPLVVDGTDGSGTYNRTKGERGGLWKGRKAIVTNIDGSARTVKLKGDDESRYIPRVDEPKQNALEVSSYMGRGAELLDPEG